MATNQELTDLLALDLGISIVNRRPHAKEIFKWQDIDLLPHSSEDTFLGEIYEWNGRNWRTTGKNMIGYLFENQALNQIKNDLGNIPKVLASVPDFEFNKDQILELGFNIPSLFKIGFTGSVQNARQLSIKVNTVTKSRITNIESPGIDILTALSEYAQKKSKSYRKNIKFNFLSRALFYAESVEVYLEREPGAKIDFNFEPKGVDVEINAETSTKKEIKLTYTGNKAPFGATFIKGKNFGI